MRIRNIFVKVKEWFTIKIGNKPVVYGIKFLPAICTALASLHIGLGLMGVDEVISLGIASALLVVLVVLLSIRFKFCALHKAMIVFLCLMVMCVSLHSKGNVGTVLSFVRLLTFILGVCLVAISIMKHKDIDGRN